MKNCVFSGLLLLFLVIGMSPDLFAENPSIDQEPDFYSMPGLNAQRSYEATDNLIIDTFSGTLQTHSVDMQLKGTGPDIVVQRAYNSVPSVISEYSYMGPGWDIHFGRIVGRYTCVDGVYTQNTLKLFYIKPDGAQVQILKGNMLWLDRNRDGLFDVGADYRPEMTTSEFWRAECRGNQLVITDTQGTNYYLGASNSPEVFAPFVVVKVEDPYSQSIEIEYELANAFSRPTRISSADGREVTFTYDGFKLSSISDGSIAVNYLYTDNHLTSVEFPESFVWQYGYKDNTRLLSNAVTPLGANITVEWDNYFFQNKDYPIVNSKCVETDCWTYSYQREYNSGTNVKDVTSISTPYGTREEYFHITPISVGDGGVWTIGLLTRKSVYREATGVIDLNDIDPCSAEGGVLHSDTPISTIAYVWKGISHSTLNRVYQNNGVALIDQVYRKPVLSYSEETKNNSTYIYEVISWFEGGFPEIIKESGNVNRYTKKDYGFGGDTQGAWFVALPTDSYVSDHDGDYEYVSGVEYNGYGRVKRKVEQGAETLLSYDSDGNLYSVTDGVGNKTYYKDYHRGVPRRVDYPDATYLSRMVDDRGRITAETNQKSITTYYSYDDLDRVTYIDMPLTENVKIEYGDNGEYKRFTKNSLRETYRYDVLGNMVQNVREDLYG